jgi:Calcineurin-like phosphoesterase
MKYDFIGDIHGHADKLEQLLKLMGYQKIGGIYQHSERKIFFLGDLIDNGPKIADVLDIALPMIEAGAAKAVMGNHEFNFLSYHTQGEDGEWLRSRSKEHARQCSHTLKQLTSAQKERLLNFIWTIPLWHEDESFQAVHACWEESQLKLLKQLVPGRLLTPAFLREANRKKSPAYEAIETLLKGLEVKIPEPLHFFDKYNTRRDNARVCWWNEERKIVIPGKLDLALVEAHKGDIIVPRVTVSKPTFFGHYWETGTPKIINPKAVCLDYSVARENGTLCAYRFSGEQELKTENLIYV